MFLLVSVRYVGAHSGEHQHDVSIQISISLGTTFLRISRIRNIPLTWMLARVFVYAPPFISQILDFIYWTALIFILIYFEWRDTENQQLARTHDKKKKRLHFENLATKASETKDFLKSILNAHWKLKRQVRSYTSVVLPQPSPQEFSARSFLDSTMSCDVTKRYSPALSQITDQERTPRD